MSNKDKGYQLADGTWSAEYKTGDKFEVLESRGVVLSGDIVALQTDDESDCPWFIILGKSSPSDEWAVPWENLKAVNPKPKTFTTFTKKDLKDGMWVTYREGGKRLYVNGVLYSNDSDKGQFRFTAQVFHYEESLLHQDTDALDIIKVEYMGEVLWEREEQTEEHKRIKELEGIIKKAQEELNKMGVNNEV